MSTIEQRERYRNAGLEIICKKCKRNPKEDLKTHKGFDTYDLKNPCKFCGDELEVNFIEDKTKVKQ